VQSEVKFRRLIEHLWEAPVSKSRIYFAAALAVSVLSAVPAQAQFGGLRDAADVLRGLAKKKTRTAPPPDRTDYFAAVQCVIWTQGPPKNAWEFDGFSLQVAGGSRFGCRVGRFRFYLAIASTRSQIFASDNDSRKIHLTFAAWMAKVNVDGYLRDKRQRGAIEVVVRFP
jgi:hypothetical protein